MCRSSPSPTLAGRRTIGGVVQRRDVRADIHGVGAGVRHKHWGCRGPLVIDARIEPRHAPPLVEDAAVSRRVEELAARGGPLAGLF